MVVQYELSQVWMKTANRLMLTFMHDLQQCDAWLKGIRHNMCQKHHLGMCLEVTNEGKLATINST